MHTPGIASPHQLQLAPSTIALQPGAAVEHEPHVDVVGQHQRLDTAARAAQAERRDRQAQLGVLAT
jgi:hypothetical protein